MRFRTTEISPYGTVYSVGKGFQSPIDVAREVEEYFDMGIELKPGQTVLDVGANIGLFSIVAASRVDGIKIHAFEPIPHLFAALQKNFERNPVLNQSSFELHQMGLGRPEDEGMHEFVYFKNLPTDSTRFMGEKRLEFEDFFEAKGNTFENFVSKKIRLGPVGSVMGRLIKNLPKGSVGRTVTDWVSGSQKVQCKIEALGKKMTEFPIQQVDLLKIDVEGSEAEVLGGICDQSWPKINQVVLEGHDRNGRANEIRDLLESRGLETIKISTPADTAERGLNNFLIHSKRMA